MAEVRGRAATRRALEARAATARPLIFQDFTWTVGEIELDSPRRFLTDTTESACWQAFLELFAPDDIIWVGEPEDSGRPQHAINFRRVAEWRHLPAPRGNFTCPSVFRRGIVSRSNANVASRPYLVVECDALLGECVTLEQRLANKDACGAIFRWLREQAGLKLRMVVDTGNKSLHGWFDMPPDKTFEELKVILPVLGADRATLKASQPVRVPGAVRQVDGRDLVQKILFLDLT